VRAHARNEYLMEQKWKVTMPLCDAIHENQIVDRDNRVEIEDSSVTHQLSFSLEREREREREVWEEGSEGSARSINLLRMSRNGTKNSHNCETVLFSPRVGRERRTFFATEMPLYARP
jgi:hypothetical protein